MSKHVFPITFHCNFLLSCMGFLLYWFAASRISSKLSVVENVDVMIKDRSLLICQSVNMAIKDHCMFVHCSVCQLIFVFVKSHHLKTVSSGNVNVVNKDHCHTHPGPSLT